jgi:hypothetical protein
MSPVRLMRTGSTRLHARAAVALLVLMSVVRTSAQQAASPDLPQRAERHHSWDVLLAGGTLQRNAMSKYDRIDLRQRPFQAGMFEPLGKPGARPWIAATGQQPQAVRERSTRRKVFGAIVGGAGGFFGGFFLGAAIEGDRCNCDDPGFVGALIGAPVGAAAGSILGYKLLF